MASEGLLARICKGEIEENVTKPIVEVLELKDFVQTTNSQRQRYRLVIFDGDTRQVAILRTRLSHLVKDRTLQLGSIVQLNNYCCKVFGEGGIIIIKELEVLETMVVVEKYNRELWKQMGRTRMLKELEKGQEDLTKRLTAQKVKAEEGKKAMEKEKEVLQAQIKKLQKQMDRTRMFNGDQEELIQSLTQQQAKAEEEKKAMQKEKEVLQLQIKELQEQVKRTKREKNQVRAEAVEEFKQSKEFLDIINQKSNEAMVDSWKVALQRVTQRFPNVPEIKSILQWHPCDSSVGLNVIQEELEEVWTKLGEDQSTSASAMLFLVDDDFVLC